MKKIVFLLLFAISLFGFDLDWSHDYDESIEKAQEDNKKIYVLITSDSCGWCRKFEKTTARDKNILKKLNKDYILVHLSRERHDIPVSLETSPVPRHYFLANDEEVLFATLGYRDIETFDYFIDNANEKYEKIKK